MKRIVKIERYSGWLCGLRHPISRPFSPGKKMPTPMMNHPEMPPLLIHPEKRSHSRPRHLTFCANPSAERKQRTNTHTRIKKPSPKPTRTPLRERWVSRGRGVQASKLRFLSKMQKDSPWAVSSEQWERFGFRTCARSNVNALSRSRSPHKLPTKKNPLTTTSEPWAVRSAPLAWVVLIFPEKAERHTVKTERPLSALGSAVWQ